MCQTLKKSSANELAMCYSRSQAVMSVCGKVVRQEEEAKQGAAEHRCNPIEYNRRLEQSSVS